MVLTIGVSGKICSGKSVFAEYLAQKHKFTEVVISEQSTAFILQNLEKIFQLKQLEIKHLSGKQFKQALKTQVDLDLLFGKKEFPEKPQTLQDLKKETKLLKKQQYQIMSQQQLQQQSQQQLQEQIGSDVDNQKLIEQYNTIIQQIQSEINLSDQQERDINQHIEILQDCLKNWYKQQVINPIRFKTELDIMRLRNFFHLISIDSPVLDRWERFQNKYPEFICRNNFSMEHFIALDDFIHFFTEQKMIIQKSNFIIFNSESLQGLKNKIEKDIHRIIRPFRPSWDQYFMTVAYALKQRSNCMKISTGAVLVKDQRIVSTGYNGTPQNVENCYQIGCEDCNSNHTTQPQLDKCICLHAEEAAILEAGVQVTQNCTLFTTTFPCIWCAKCIIQAQVKRVCYHLPGPHDEDAKQILDQYVVINQTELTDLLFHIQ